MAGAFTIQNNPPFLNARSGIYTAWTFRDTLDDFTGPGVADYESFRVKQRGAGANLSADIGNTSLNRACIRGTTRDGMGFYFAENIDYTAPTTNTFLAQINTGLIFTTGDATNPRIDQVFLRILDQQHDGGASNLLQVQVVDGTATVGATLDNRTGVGAVPANSILLADVLMPALASTVTTANIRDRRAFPLQCTPGITGFDAVPFVPAPGLYQTECALTPATHDSMQSAALMYLPRRIVGATRIRWRYGQNATAATSNYTLAIVDASGRLIVAATPTAFTSTASQYVNITGLAITATTFEPGWYYVFFGVAPITAASGVGFFGVALTVALPPTFHGSQFVATAYRNAAGGTTFPASNTILGMTDVVNGAAATTSLPVPIVELSVG